MKKKTFLFCDIVFQGCDIIFFDVMGQVVVSPFDVEAVSHILKAAVVNQTLPV